MENVYIPPITDGIGTKTDIVSSQRKSLNLKEIVAVFLSAFIFYWIGYLYFNWTFRIGSGSGISISPQEGNPGQFLLVPIAAAISVGIILMSRSLRYSGRGKWAIVVLAIPAFLLFLMIASLLFSSCTGECGLGAAIIVGVGVMIVIGIYISVLITNIITYLVNKYKSSFIVLVVLSILIFVIPIIYSFSVEVSFKNKITEKEIPINKITLQKTQISEIEYNVVNKLEECCEVLEKRPDGTTVIAKLGPNRFLLQGPVEKYTQINGQPGDRASLLIQNGGRILNIGKGVNFSAFSGLSRIGWGTRPIFLSVSKDLVAFFQEYLDGGDFIISKLNGGGIYVDDNFCPWSCKVEWGKDGFIYLTVSQQDRSKMYYKVTPP